MTAHLETHPATLVVHGRVLVVEVECVVLRCHACDAVHVTEGHAVREATEAARVLGWTHRPDDEDGCPAHPVGRAE